MGRFLSLFLSFFLKWILKDLYRESSCVSIYPRIEQKPKYRNTKKTGRENAYILKNLCSPAHPTGVPPQTANLCILPGRHIQPCWEHTSVLCLDLPPPLCDSDIVYLLRCQSSEPGSKFSLDLNSIHVVPPTVQVPANTSDAPSWSTLGHFLRQRRDHISLLSQSRAICGLFIRNASGRLRFACTWTT